MLTEPNTCVANDEGRACTRDAVMLRPVPLCQEHRIEVALITVPDILRDSLAAAAARPTPRTAVRHDLIDKATATSVQDLLHGVHRSIVYFISNGGRVKIGYTTNLKNRVAALALRTDSVLLALHGGPDLERALHAKFAAHRDRNTEWFDLAPEILSYIAGREAEATQQATPTYPPLEAPRTIADDCLWLAEQGMPVPQIANNYGMPEAWTFRAVNGESS